MWVLFVCKWRCLQWCAMEMSSVAALINVDPESKKHPLGFHAPPPRVYNMCYFIRIGLTLGCKRIFSQLLIHWHTQHYLQPNVWCPCVKHGCVLYAHAWSMDGQLMPMRQAWMTGKMLESTKTASLVLCNCFFLRSGSLGPLPRSPSLSLSLAPPCFKAFSLVSRLEQLVAVAFRSLRIGIRAQVDTMSRHVVGWNMWVYCDVCVRNSSHLCMMVTAPYCACERDCAISLPCTYSISYGTSSDVCACISLIVYWRQWLTCRAYTW